MRRVLAQGLSSCALRKSFQSMEGTKSLVPGDNQLKFVKDLMIMEAESVTSQLREVVVSLLRL